MLLLEADQSPLLQNREHMAPYSRSALVAWHNSLCRPIHLMDTCCREETHTAILSKEPYLPSHLSMECKDFLRQVCPPVMATLWCWPVKQSEQHAAGLLPEN